MRQADNSSIHKTLVKSTLRNSIRFSLILSIQAVTYGISAQWDLDPYAPKSVEMVFTWDLVTRPFAPENGYVDVTGSPPGSEVTPAVTTGFSARAESAPELSERTVDLGNDVSLGVIEASQLASGATLVLIPGWSTTADIWREQINRFAPTYRVISFDPRSQGRSTITTDGNTPETRAQDLHTLLDLLCVRRPVLIGWSQGVGDIAAFINRYGTRDVSRIVLVDAAISTGAEGMGARGAPRPAALFETFAVYQAHQQKYLADMMRAIIRKPQSNDAN